jgi:tRNA-specific 2-thiouridylase
VVTEGRHDDGVASERILVAMSGGVDSSVAAALLREQGHECVGVTLHLWDAAGEQKVGRCCAPEDRDDARKTCEAIGIPHYVIDERSAFREKVVDPFIRGYASGDTPSPCVTCNQHVKLGRLAELADALGCTSIATGHYARVEKDGGDVALLRGVDASKDQSYFLFGVPRSILARLVLPLGALDKGTTREEGRRLGVPNWDKRDSQELCFVPDGNVGSFVEREGVAPQKGALVSADGAVVGEHAGVHHFTVGQRRGLGLGGGPARYVLRVVPERAEVVVGDEAGLYAAGLRASEARWIDLGRAGAFDAEIQVRHHHKPAPARIECDGDGFVARFTAPQRAIARGQAAVVYVGPRVLGGGTIAATL